MMQALELLWLAKSDEVASNNAKIKPVALVVIELRFSEGISK